MLKMDFKSNISLCRFINRVHSIYCSSSMLYGKI